VGLNPKRRKRRVDQRRASHFLKEAEFPSRRQEDSGDSVKVIAIHVSIKEGWKRGASSVCEGFSSEQHGERGGEIKVGDPKGVRTMWGSLKKKAEGKKCPK